MYHGGPYQRSVLKCVRVTGNWNSDPDFILSFPASCNCLADGWAPYPALIYLRDIVSERSDTAGSVAVKRWRTFLGQKVPQAHMQRPTYLVLTR